jgi:hypothetical protein
MVKVCKRSPTVTTCAKRDTNGGSECGTPSEKTSMLRTRKKSSRNLKEAQKGQLPSIASTGRSSIYRGVTRHRWTGRFEAHLWDKSCWNDKQNKKGKQGNTSFASSSYRTSHRVSVLGGSQFYFREPLIPVLTQALKTHPGF